MSAWMDSVFRTVLSRSTEDVPGQVSASIRRKRLLIAGGIAAGIVALVVGILVWRYYRGKKSKKAASERKNNPSVAVRKKRSSKSKEPSVKTKKGRKTNKAKPRRRTAKRLKDTTEIQTLIFSKKKFGTADEAKEWAKEHDFKTTKVDETGQSFRLRQHVPGLYGPRSFRTITVTDGIKGVVARRKAA